MKIKKWHDAGDQYCRLGSHHWSVSRLIDLSKDFEVIDADINLLNVYLKYENLTLREMVMHMKAAMNADLSCPVILDEDGEVMDGRHRIMKAMFLGVDKIKVVRFDENPVPCKVEGDNV